MIQSDHEQTTFGYDFAMYVCICNAVNESAIRQAVEDGVTSFRGLSLRTGCGTQCGSCVKQAREILDRALEDAGSAKSTVKLQFAAAN
jgi:bacterioferritin-associated ferredoxin